MKEQTKHVAVLVHDYFEQSEFEEPIRTLRDSGVDVTVVSAGKTQLHGMQHANIGDEFQADMLLQQANPDDYDALLLPGGVVNADSLRTNEEAQEWVVDFLDSPKPVAMICHAPWILVSADAVEGRRLTSYYSLKDDIRNAGGEWVDMEVVTDGNLISSRQPGDIPAFTDELLVAMDVQAGYHSTTAGSSTSTGAAAQKEHDADTLQPTDLGSEQTDTH